MSTKLYQYEKDTYALMILFTSYKQARTAGERCAIDHEAKEHTKRTCLKNLWFCMTTEHLDNIHEPEQSPGLGDPKPFNQE